MQSHPPESYKARLSNLQVFCFVYLNELNIIINSKALKHYEFIKHTLSFSFEIYSFWLHYLSCFCFWHIKDSLQQIRLTQAYTYIRHTYTHTYTIYSSLHTLSHIHNYINIIHTLKYINGSL